VPPPNDLQRPVLMSTSFHGFFLTAFVKKVAGSYVSALCRNRNV
jgi:hypothetical protein